MHGLATATLSAPERRVVERLVESLQAVLGSHLRSVWLYGSRARGDHPGEDSDVDLLVVSTRGAKDDDLLVIELAIAAALEEGGNPFAFSVKLYDPELIARRREIGSFFMQEVDREKIVLAGEP
jgi:predicted nucleotidyltransferase